MDEHPGVECYVILDDDATDMNGHGKHFIRTDPEFGLTYAEANRAIEMLR